MNPLHHPDFRKELNECLTRLKCLADGLQPADRMVFLNELIVRLMPERQKSTHAQDKATSNTRSPLQGLTNDQLELVRKLAAATEGLSGFHEGKAA